MYRQSIRLLLFSKPITQGYVASLPSPPSSVPGRQWARAMDANNEVRNFYTPNAEKYEAWYKETYGLEDISDGCAASGAQSNRLLDDHVNLQRAATEYNLDGVKEELQYWCNEFTHLNQKVASVAIYLFKASSVRCTAEAVEQIPGGRGGCLYTKPNINPISNFSLIHQQGYDAQISATKLSEGLVKDRIPTHKESAQFSMSYMDSPAMTSLPDQNNMTSGPNFTQTIGVLHTPRTTFSSAERPDSVTETNAIAEHFSCINSILLKNDHPPPPQLQSGCEKQLGMMASSIPVSVQSYTNSSLSQNTFNRITSSYTCSSADALYDYNGACCCNIRVRGGCAKLQGKTFLSNELTHDLFYEYDNATTKNNGDSIKADYTISEEKKENAKCTSHYENCSNSRPFRCSDAMEEGSVITSGCTNRTTEIKVTPFWNDSFSHTCGLAANAMDLGIDSCSANCFFGHYSFKCHADIGTPFETVENVNSATFSSDQPKPQVQEEFSVSVTASKAREEANLPTNLLSTAFYSANGGMSFLKASSIDSADDGKKCSRCGSDANDKGTPAAANTVSSMQSQFQDETPHVNEKSLCIPEETEKKSEKYVHMRNNKKNLSQLLTSGAVASNRPQPDPTDEHLQIDARSFGVHGVNTDEAESNGVELSSTMLTYNSDAEECVTVVDPQRRKLRIPLSSIFPTKAFNGRLTVPSLCLLYQSGRCRQGQNCFQVHADIAVVKDLRTGAENQPCCCAFHDDLKSDELDFKSYEGRSIVVACQHVIPISRLAYTIGLQRVLANNSTCWSVNATVLCRLHNQQEGCRFGTDCKFIHVCHQILKNELFPFMINLSSEAASSVSIKNKTLGQSTTEMKDKTLIQAEPSIGRTPWLSGAVGSSASGNTYCIFPYPNDKLPCSSVPIQPITSISPAINATPLGNTHSGPIPNKEPTGTRISTRPTLTHTAPLQSLPITQMAYPYVSTGGIDTVPTTAMSGAPSAAVTDGAPSFVTMITPPDCGKTFASPIVYNQAPSPTLIKQAHPFPHETVIPSQPINLLTTGGILLSDPRVSIPQQGYSFLLQSNMSSQHPDAPVANYNFLHPNGSLDQCYPTQCPVQTSWKPISIAYSPSQSAASFYSPCLSSLKRAPAGPAAQTQQYFLQCVNPDGSITLMPVNRDGTFS